MKNAQNEFIINQLISFKTNDENMTPLMPQAREKTSE
jgi:hypothetical protein